MTCLADETVARFVEGNLDSAGRDLVWAHLDRCPDCRRLVAGMVRRTHAGAAIDPLSVSAGLLPWQGRLGRYSIRSSLGRGSMGAVFRAYDPELHRDVAIKVVATDEHTAATQDRLLEEARALAQLNHPNVVPVYDAGISDGVVYLVMECVEGMSLAAWLDQAPRPRTAILEVFEKAARGLSAMHEVGLVHRDFKPQNVLTASDGRVLISDFGLVCRLPPTTVTDQSADANGWNRADEAMAGVAGTPAYMAPEQLRGEPASPQSDQFSLCVALFEAVCGQPPFSGRNLAARHQQIVERRIAPCLVAQPRPVRRLLRRGLAPDPAERFPSMDALARELGARHRHPAVLGLAAVATIAMTGTIATLATRPPREDPCRWIDRGAIWSPATRRDVEQAFAAVELPVAGATWNRVDKGLTAFERDWKSQALELCRTNPNKHQRCLEEQRWQAVATVDVLETTDPELVDRAASLIEQLPDARDCSSDPQRRPPSSAEHPELERRIALSEALRNAGRVAAAEAEAAAALALARRHSLRAFEQRAELQLGLALNRQERLEEAEAHTERAHWLALARDDPRAAAWAAIELVAITARRQDFERNDHWLRQVEADLERAGSRDDLIDSHLAQVRAVSYWRRGETRTAIDEMERAQELQLRSGRTDVARTASMYGDTATFLLELGEVAEAERRYRRAVELLEEGAGPEHANTILTLVGLGVCQLRAGELEASRRTLELAAQRADAGYGPDSSLSARVSVNLASTLSALGELDLAETHYLRGQEIWLRRHGPDEPDLRHTYEGLAVVARFRGNRDAAFDWLYKAAGSCERAYGSDHPCNGEVAYELSGTAALFDEYDEALRHARNAGAAWSRALGPDHIPVAFALRNEGDALVRLDRPGEAIAVYERALQIHEQIGSPSAPAATVRSGLAEALLAVGRADDAEAPARQALDGPLLPIHRGHVRFVLARILLAQGRRSEAATHARDARTAMIELGTHMKPYIDDLESWMREHQIRFPDPPPPTTEGTSSGKADDSP